MLMDPIDKYLVILRDQEYPENRIFKKTGILAIVMIFMLIFYRHVVLGFGFFEPVLVTIGLVFLVFVIVGFFGAALVGYIYLSFLKSVGARDYRANITVHFVEWLFALLAPVFGLLLFIFINFQVLQL